MKMTSEEKSSFAVGLVIALLVIAVSYATSNNLGKLQERVPVDSPLYSLAQDISVAYPAIITNKGIANSLASKVLSAQTALNSGRTTDAVSALQDLMNELRAQSGKNIKTTFASKLTDSTSHAIAQIITPVPACDGEYTPNGDCCPNPYVIHIDGTCGLP